MTTNRAFIKAYRHDVAEPTPAAPVLVDTARPAAATIQLVAAATDFGAATTEPHSRIAVPLSESIDVLPPAAQPFVGTTHAFDEGRSFKTASSPVGRLAIGDASVEAARLHSGAPKIAGRKRPLSAYIGRQRSEQTTASDSTKSDVFRPGTTVASFRWPAVSRTLAQKCRSELDRVADLLLTESEQGQSIIGVAGLFPTCGSTTTLLALAARVAVRKRKTLLIDGNFTRPQLATSLDAEPTAGWQEVLSGSAPLSDAVIRAADDSIDLLALGAKPTNDPLRLVAGAQTEICAKTILRHYELVLIDLGAYFDPKTKPIMVELIRNMRVDAVLVVTLAEETDARDLSIVAEQFGDIGCKLLGRIENRVANMNDR
jgi:Mrp family chromosome partitioning ATPase